MPSFLRIKVFFGTSENAVKTQILQILSLSIFEIVNINQLLTPPPPDSDPDFEPNQLARL